MLLKGGNKITLVSKHLNRCIPELSPLIMLLKGGNKITLVSKQLKRCIPELSPLIMLLKGGNTIIYFLYSWTENNLIEA
jgi:hypothetical protein